MPQHVWVWHLSPDGKYGNRKGYLRPELEMFFAPTYDDRAPGFFLWERSEGRMRVEERARKCVAFIGIQNDREQFVPHGTGFFLSIVQEGRRFDHIVTCEHVIDGIAGDNVWVRVNAKEEGSATYAVPKKRWFRHPNKKPYFDVAVVPTVISAESHDVTHVYEQDFATRDLINDKQITTGEPTFLVGLFTSHYGEGRNEPIVRIGHIAAMPKDPIWTNRGYAEGYLVEARSIGGLSGSPVFVHIEPFRMFNGDVRPSENVLTHYFLGMMRGRHNVQGAEDVVAGDNPADTVNAGIGLVTPVEVIMEVINQEPLLAERQAILDRLKQESLFRETSAPSPAESEPPTTGDNPSHREDFQSMLRAAARKKKRGD